MGQEKTPQEDSQHLEHKRTSDSVMGPGYGTKKTSTGSDDALPSELISAGSQDLHRKLGGKEVQLFAVGGAIGTCKFGRNDEKRTLLTM